MATTTPNFGWPVPTSTDLVKNGATAIEGLGDAIDASLLDIKGGTTGQVLAKASGTDMDFSWVAQDDSNAIQNTIVDAKADLITATAADTPARLAVGTNNYFLQAASGEATGLKWGGAFTSYTPALENVTSGNATISGGYIKIGKFVTGYYKFQWGSTTSGNASQQVFYLPTTPKDTAAYTISFLDYGTVAYSGFAEVIGSGFYLRNMIATGTYVTGGAVTSTSPMTWTTQDTLSIAYNYEEA
jgi:hypothetical protein